MQQEDDLRGLAKVMEFMRAISIIFIVVHIYWFCYQAIVDIANRLPEKIVQEDPNLLMYYDISLSRI